MYIAWKKPMNPFFGKYSWSTFAYQDVLKIKQKFAKDHTTNWHNYLPRHTHQITAQQNKPSIQFILFQPMTEQAHMLLLSHQSAWNQTQQMPDSSIPNFSLPTSALHYVAKME